MSVVQVSHIVKSFGTLRVLNDVSFEVEGGGAKVAEVGVDALGGDDEGGAGGGVLAVMQRGGGIGLEGLGGDGLGVDVGLTRANQMTPRETRPFFSVTAVVR